MTKDNANRNRRAGIRMTACRYPGERWRAPASGPMYKCLPRLGINPFYPPPAYTAISVGSLHACALDASGNAYCWGANTHGELGNGTVGDSNRPTKVSGGIQFYQISAGSEHTCALTRDGMVYCWGLEDYGEVGNHQIGGSQLTPTLVAVQNANDTYVAVSAGGHDSCAVTRNGNALCWGASWLGELGIGSQIGAYGGMPSDMNESVAAPLNASALPFVTTLNALSAGRQHTCGVVDFAAGLRNPVYCWGDNLDSEVSPTASGICPTTGTPSTFPCSISPEEVGRDQASAVTSGGDFTCGLGYLAYVVSCWGSDEVGQFGSSPNHQCAYLYTTIYCDPTPTPVNTALQFDYVSAGFEFACALTMPDEAPWCWGANDHGQLGTTVSLAGQPCHSIGGTLPTCAAKPVPVNLPMRVFQMSTGGNTACAVTSSNTIYCWGDNSRGQLGNGTTGGTSATPVQVAA